MDIDKFLPFLNGLTITAALAWFLWWKSTIHKEIVQPSVDGLKNSLNARMDYLESRVKNTEELYIRMQDNLEHKVDKLQDTMSHLAKEVAELTGQLKAMSREN